MAAEGHFLIRNLDWARMPDSWRSSYDRLSRTLADARIRDLPALIAQAPVFMERQHQADKQLLFEMVEQARAARASHPPSDTVTHPTLAERLRAVTPPLDVTS